MDNIFSIVDLGHVGLSLERLRVSVAAENIANVHNLDYVSKEINKQEFKSLLSSDAVSWDNHAEFKEEIGNVIDVDGKPINLDGEVLNVSDAEIRYQAIAQMIQKKFGLLELSMGVKK